MIDAALAQSRERRLQESVGHSFNLLRKIKLRLARLCCHLLVGWQWLHHGSSGGVERESFGVSSEVAGPSVSFGREGGGVSASSGEEQQIIKTCVRCSIHRTRISWFSMLLCSPTSHPQGRAVILG